ncbi:Deoxyguanosinetriphosphate triphosphohydrolase-like protein [Deinococcus proteolyticus MRP]|uniref:Deoxyguanosinetriphosphate triphosphohydrolase-like protein n=1 Tax=Deinococcus proteolyticus (strain ATCC 35074 / DSM 20540 / JCM 6276 / NBRC 101906 / NCIMB 13154 / VKM Ac-1939 / CCM 2703 / MRP) TaxID=693977 RepID=F0RJG5_DEIPM|nr:dNTP triphosphohydrolase [Deinococcus proteolyticus]ADY25506.1 Deoxyguanosinetriphosphate triphosphohydrolase-like protein [Deinococcus proteolyticus MRP]
MLTRADLEAREAATLAPYAALSRDSGGREYAEPESESRTAFQKDRDRVLHTGAFRRLEHKTQVFLNVRGDHYRTRLTHTLEVQQVARSAALRLGLNETLAEAQALAHDLGHPPYGHAGERLLDELVRAHGEPSGFDHNHQARRIVTQLEDRYPDFPGLNLTRTVLDGLNKHERAGAGQPTLEAQLVDLADALAYTAHDLEDGLRSGLLQEGELQELRLWREMVDRSGLGGAALGKRERRTLHRELLGFLIGDLTRASAEAVARSGVSSVADVRAQEAYLMGHSREVAALLGETRQFLYGRLYRHWRVEMQVAQAEQILTTLFGAYLARPQMLPPAYAARLKVAGEVRTVCDFIAGMTDRYALDIYEELTRPGLGLEWTR